MPGPADLARGWMQKGDSDRFAANGIAQTPGPYDTVCFHAQQAAEKYLKAVIALAGAAIPRVHDLDVVYEACLRVSPGMSLDRAELRTLTPYAIQLRYDSGFWPDVATARRAIEIADRVRSAVLSVLPRDAHP